MRYLRLALGTIVSAIVATLSAAMLLITGGLAFGAAQPSVLSDVPLVLKPLLVIVGGVLLTALSGPYLVWIGFIWAWFGVVLFGVPLHFVLRRLGRTKVLDYTTAGVLAGGATALFLAIVSPTLQAGVSSGVQVAFGLFAFAIVAGAGAGGAAFWLATGRE